MNYVSRKHITFEDLKNYKESTIQVSLNNFSDLLKESASIRMGYKNSLHTTLHMSKDIVLIQPNGNQIRIIAIDDKTYKHLCYQKDLEDLLK